ncbi:MAG TPA: APC family permease [Candidatus Dormibacteraeota bacterium]
MAQGVIPAPQATPQITGQLRREVGLTALMFISLGSIIGSGWLLGALLAAQIAGPASLVSWILGGAIIALLALIHAELGAAYPMAGGTARFPHLVFGSIPGFTAGWAAWLQAVTIAPIEVEAALSYLNNKAPGLVKADMTLTGEGLLVSAALMFAFTVLNILGVRWLAESNKITVIWKTAIPVLTVIVLLVVSFHVSNFTAGGGFAPFGVHGIFAALPAGIVFAVQGFEQAIQMGGEAKNPARDMPRAVIGAMVIGTVIYLFLELAFIGALDPNNLVHGWAGSIVGKGDFGPYATIATGLGLGWLAALLYIDAFISPAGTGLVYLGTSSRLSYALGRNGYLPGAVDKVSKRGVPWVSILLAFGVGLIVFLPFPSWQSLVGLVTSATAIMYAFAPVSLGALRKSDPDRERPYRLPFAAVLSPLGFVCANLIVYWSGWTTVNRLFGALILGLVAFAISMVLRKPDKRPVVDWKASIWVLPWLVGMAVISYLGQFTGGTGTIPFYVDLVVVTIFSLIIYYMAVALSMPADKVQAAIAAEELEVAGQPELKVAG